MSLSERVLSIRSEALSQHDKLALVAVNLLCLAGELLGMVGVSPGTAIHFKAGGSYGGDEDSQVRAGETEAVSLSFPVWTGEAEGSYLQYAATVVVNDDPDNPLVTVRGIAELRELEQMYRELRYGSLLESGVPLPPEHLVSFEQLPGGPLVVWGSER